MRAATTRRLTVAAHYARLAPAQKIVSSLRLVGEWLTLAGFAPGAVAEVHVEAGRLIITRKEVGNG